MAAETRCPLCDARAHRSALVDGGHALWRCSACGAGFLWPQPSDQELERAYASDYYGADGAKFRAPFERAMTLAARSFARRILSRSDVDLPNWRVLDVGCGRGLLLRAFLDVADDVQAHGFERSRHATRGIDARVRVHIGTQLADMFGGGDVEPFGLVIWRHVLEHVRDPVAELATSRRLLAPGGVLVVEVPHFGGAQARFGGERWFHLDPPRHLFHFTEAALRVTLARAGFVVDDKSVRRASWAQDPMGWVQSALHRMGRPRDAFFSALKANVDAGRASRLANVDTLLGVALTPTAVVASAVDAALFGGGTLTLHARPA